MVNEKSETDQTETFIRLITENERKLGRYTMMMVPHVQDADEILQEAKMVMWRSFDSFKVGTDFAAWSRRVIFNQVLKYRRQSKKRVQPFRDETLQLLATEIDSKDEHFDNRHMSLSSCMAKLSEEHRKILALRYNDEHSIERIAEQVDRTSGAIYRLLSRIRKSLHDCISNSKLSRSEP